MSSIAKIKANNTEYDVVGLGVENVKNDSFIGTWQGSQQEWEQAEITDWRKWQTDAIGTATSSASTNWVENRQAYGSCYQDGAYYMTHQGSTSGNGLYKSTDKKNWTNVKSVSGLKYILHAKGKYIIYMNAKLYSAPEDTPLESSTWQENATVSGVSPNGTTGKNLFECGNKVFLTYSGSDYYYSDDGITWNTSTLPKSLSSYATRFAYFNNKYIALGWSANKGYYLESSDGITWTDNSIKIGDVIGDSKIVAVYDMISNGSTFVCSALGSQNTNKGIYSTTDFINWSSSDPLESSTQVFYYNNGIFIANPRSTSYGLAYSTDGVTWYTTPSQTKDYDQMVYVGNDTYVGFSTGGYRPKAVLDLSFSSSACYTTTTTPDTTSTVYSAPNTTSALTITSVGTGTITLSDTNVYNRQAGGDTQTYQDVASLYPNHLAFVDNVGVKIGNTLIADMSSRADTDLSNLSATGKAVVSNLSMPSTKYDELTLGASDTEYTAPADGWVIFGKQSTAANQQILLSQDSYIWTICWAAGSGANLFVYMPVKSGTKFFVAYTAAGSTQVFRFYYAEGDK